ncbi:hypothetical protein Val02_13480 [Virgisporangium aliadipatigenens]|uniref:Uncharacterized protein n=1 Tax=Virgisporangium aliadipatigenens TaxID=741659 RepID=A0A8J3YHD9_9ACTN|nr:hypothetical protein Val02_13480 [Virgisporangium aliadipatigenens]
MRHEETVGAHGPGIPLSNRPALTDAPIRNRESRRFGQPTPFSLVKGTSEAPIIPSSGASS